MLDEHGLVHMNGRLYDPEIGRFLQADPIIQEPLNGQNYNRYAYVQNNPLSYTDPTGFSWWTKWRRPIIGLIAAIAVPWAVGEIFMANASVGGALAEIGSAEIISLTATGKGAAAVAGGAAAGGIQGGNVQSAVIGAFTAGLQFGVGQALGHSTPSLFSAGAGRAAQKMIAHAAIGCASAAASGGSCKAGAAAAGFSSFAGGSIPGANNILGRAAAGAIAAKLAGGKAEQGALLAAMEFLYNECGATFMCRGQGYSGSPSDMAENAMRPATQEQQDAAGERAVAAVALYPVARFAVTIARGLQEYFSGSPSGLGDLTRGEVQQIQSLVDKVQKPLEVVGSAARGERNARSDIDYIAHPAHLREWMGPQKTLPKIDSKTGVFPGNTNPFQGPGIRFEPGRAPQLVKPPGG